MLHWVFKNIIVSTLTKKQKKFVYAEKADVLNVTLFGITDKEWNLGIADKRNIRNYTDLLHLVILSNLENINVELIKMKIPQNERFIEPNFKKVNEIIKK